MLNKEKEASKSKKKEENKYIFETKFALYGFNLCRQKYAYFNYLKELVNCNKEDDFIKINLYTYYLEFLCELFEFYIAIGKKEDIITKDFDKEMKKDLIIEATERLFRFFLINKIPPDLADFADKFRELRNFKSHIPSQMLSQIPSLTDFYRKYHKYVVLLMEPLLFSWNHPTEIWDDINLFSLQIKNSQ